jgi:hypothetical protein
MRLIIAAALLALPVSGFAAPEVETKAEARPDKKICKVDPEDTESRIRRRVCKTEAEWNGTKSDKDQAASTSAGSSHDGR